MLPVLIEIKTKEVAEKFQIQQLSVGTILHVFFRSVIDFRKPLTAVDGGDFDILFCV